MMNGDELRNDKYLLSIVVRIDRDTKKLNRNTFGGKNENGSLLEIHKETRLIVFSLIRYNHESSHRAQIIGLLAGPRKHLSKNLTDFLQESMVRTRKSDYLHTMRCIKRDGESFNLIYPHFSIKDGSFLSKWISWFLFLPAWSSSFHSSNFSTSSQVNHSISISHSLLFLSDLILHLLLPSPVSHSDRKFSLSFNFF